MARKNAKSTVAAVLANWFLVMEKGQQDIYTAAVSRDQARIVFDDARQMCLLSPPLRKRVQIQQHKLIYPQNNSLTNSPLPRLFSLCRSIQFKRTWFK
ncbi:hypothetical protein UR07_09580 [Pasteurella multocida subsp. multocida]|nr:hypothetical protein UR07_09580 [Pasteurella multocida subsp. multocida]PNW24798.1 hypothetical protein AP056_03505 [Pasteurella multocida subsp. multocida]